MNGVCLLMIGDGRDDVHELAHASLKENLPGKWFDQVVVVDDRDHRLGFGGAIQHGWDQIRPEILWVFHMEMDFTFNAPVPLNRMVSVLEANPYLAQVALKRQPWNPDEIAAGGIIEQHPEDYTEQRSTGGDVWTEHRRFFTTNPSVYSRRLCRLGWPQVAQSEGVFTHRLLADPHLRFAFWGAKLAPPTVHHIGAVRAGRGY